MEKILEYLMNVPLVGMHLVIDVQFAPPRKRILVKGDSRHYSLMPRVIWSLCVLPFLFWNLCVVSFLFYTWQRYICWKTREHYWCGWQYWPGKERCVRCEAVRKAPEDLPSQKEWNEADSPFQYLFTENGIYRK